MESVKWVKPTAKFYEGFRLTTNNRMELCDCRSRKLKNKYKVLVVSDSKYVVDSILKKWVLVGRKNDLDRKMLIYGSAC
jgi:ribonuclease HI